MPQDSDMGSFSSPSATMKAANFQVIPGKVSTDFYKQSINFCCEFITTIGAFILIFGVAVSTMNILVSIVNDLVGTDYPMLMSLQRNKQCAATFARVRIQLGKLGKISLECELQTMFASLTRRSPQEKRVSNSGSNSHDYYLELTKHGRSMKLRIIYAALRFFLQRSSRIFEEIGGGKGS